ncbi:MAG: ABC transporter ATP-binding protein [Lachnospiraceae bacterium]|nr:ABC transporter ATP-binding protein [Lachnospiraceae bacterium]
MARNKYDIDETLQSKFDFKQLKRLGVYLKPRRSKFLFVIVLMLISSALGLLSPMFIQTILDTYIPEGNKGGIVFLTCLMVGITLVCAFILVLKVKLTNEIGQGIIFDLRKDLFTHLQELPFSYYDNRPHGKIQVRLVNYVNSLSDLLSNGIVNTITDLFSLIIIFIYMLLISVRLTLICMCGLPVLLMAVWFIKTRQRKAWQISSNKQSNLTAYIAESINGIRVTQSFVREDKNMEIFNSLSSSYRRAWLRAVLYNNMLWPCVDIISIGTTSAIYVIGVSMLTGNSDLMSAGILVAFIQYIGRFWQPVNTLASFYTSLLNAIAYLERIFETIDEPVLVHDAPGAGEMPPIEGSVEFKDVCFSYEEGIRVLNHVSFKTKVGDTFAIVGPTGAGKTTIINLLSRFYNIDSGAITIDGVNIQDVTIKSLRKQMGVMLQDSFIFSGTIMDNIRYGNMEATDEDVIRAAKTVCAHDFIMQMENGYQTEVNERGSRLSAGQRQLISFARALLADPKILILDEATSSIDTETEIALQRGLAELLKNRTSFVIAHRLSTIRNADKILYVDHGEICEEGTHDELLRMENGLYHKLYMSQYDFLNR